MTAPPGSWQSRVRALPGTSIHLGLVELRLPPSLPILFCTCLLPPFSQAHLPPPVSLPHLPFNLG